MVSIGPHAVPRRRHDSAGEDSTGARGAAAAVRAHGAAAGTTAARKTKDLIASRVVVVVSALRTVAERSNATVAHA